MGMVANRIAALEAVVKRPLGTGAEPPVAYQVSQYLHFGALLYTTKLLATPLVSVTQDDCKVYWPTKINSELWHSRPMGIWAHPTYSICLLAIILLRMSCLFSYYFWVISIPISVVVFFLSAWNVLPFYPPLMPLILVRCDSFLHLIRNFWW